MAENKNNRSQPAIDTVTTIDELVRQAATRLERLLSIGETNIGAQERRQLEDAVQALRAAIGHFELQAREKKESIT